MWIVNDYHNMIAITAEGGTRTDRMLTRIDKFCFRGFAAGF